MSRPKPRSSIFNSNFRPPSSHLFSTTARRCDIYLIHQPETCIKSLVQMATTATPASQAPSSPKPPAARRQKLVKRACDPCKIRKIKCSESSPCSGCVAAGIECTFHRNPQTRGPRSLRRGTLSRIARERQDEHAASAAAGLEEEQGPDETLLEVLNVYAERLFPIWPIVDAGQLHADLMNPENVKAKHLANAVALATVAQLKLDTAWKGAAQQVERDALDDHSEDLLDSLRISFFLHIYFENQIAGGTKSLVYLREAITKAQLLRIDREATYASLPEAEQQLLRRILWLLFVTERGVAMLHKLPVILRPNVLRPSVLYPISNTSPDSSTRNIHVLPAFLKLVHLFWTFDQSGIFELLRNADADVSSMESLARGCLELLQRKLTVDDGTGSEEFFSQDANDVQKADMLVTRHWMRAVLWRAALRFGVVVPGMNPVDVAGEFLALVGQLPTSALESQGPTLEFKTYEIATAVVDAVAADHPPPMAASLTLGHPKDVLAGLYNILYSSRGGNKTLLGLLNTKMATSCPDLRLLMQPSPNSTNRALLPPASMPPQAEDEWNWNYFTPTGIIGPNDFDLGQMTELAWPPLDLGSNFLRSPSPLTNMLLVDQGQQAQNQHHIQDLG